jgi:hypothetical protein
MTQKSAARQLRDKIKNDFKDEFAKNTNWDDLQARHQECAGLVAMHLGVTNVLEQPEILAEIQPDEQTLLVQNIRLLTKDLQERITELNKIYAIHSDKHGSANEENIMLSFEIMEKYTHWLALMQSNVQPTVAHILEITSVIEKRVLVKQAQMSPAFTTDVEFTEQTRSEATAQAVDSVIASADHTNPQPE